MSWIACHNCGQMIDSDAEPECFYLLPDDDKPMDYALCENCKDDILREREKTHGSDE